MLQPPPVAIQPQTTTHGGGAPVLWRTWLVVPDGPDRHPILAGLYGSPWPARDVDARCRDRTIAGAARHHPVVPEPACTCGIYAGVDELSSPRPAPRGVPFATGFVTLTGRVLRDGDVLRAQYATVTGPIVLHPGRPTAAELLVGALWPDAQRRVVTERDRFRIIRSSAREHPRAGDWLTATCGALTARYEVEVRVSGSRPLRSD